MPHFYEDLKNGGLAQYTLIQPTMATSKTQVSNWQHPDNSVAAGEALIEEVYTALKASPYWDDSLLVITYDEHGGCTFTRAQSRQKKNAPRINPLTPNPNSTWTLKRNSFRPRAHAHRGRAAARRHGGCKWFHL